MVEAAYEYEDGHESEPEEDERDLTDIIDELLADNRPERYDYGERDWQDLVIAKVADLLRLQPIEDTIDKLARRHVAAREGQAIRKLKGILREIFDNGQLPIGWGIEDWKRLYIDVLHLPLAIGSYRVQFGSATTADWEQWVAEHQEQIDRKMAADQRTGNGGRLVLQWMIDQGVERTDDLRPVQP